MSTKINEVVDAYLKTGKYTAEQMQDVLSKMKKYRIEHSKHIFQSLKRNAALPLLNGCRLGA